MTADVWDLKRWQVMILAQAAFEWMLGADVGPFYMPISRRLPNGNSGPMK